MTEFVKVAQLSEIPPCGKKVIDFEESTVAIFNIAGEFFCIEDVCTHDDGPLAEGKIEDHTIECPRHGALFDIRDGRALSMPAVTPVSTYKVKIENGEIWIESPDAW